MIKIAFIGAGSVVFCRNLTGDILGFPEFRDASIAYMDIDARRLEVAAALGRKAAEAHGAHPNITATTDLRQALDGADFVINMAQVGGFDSTLIDFEIPRKYGLNFTIGDTTGPGGMFRALRSFPMLRHLCRTMEEVCPRAMLLNYSNPMSMNMQTIARTSGVRAVGLCHSVQGTLCQIMSYIGVDPAEVAFTCAGINHMAFYLKLERAGEDLYPRLFEAMNNPRIYGSNKVRFELMRRLGYFVTESSEHNAEYNPYFIPHGREFASRFAIPIDEYLRRCEGIVDEFERMCCAARSDEPMQCRRSHEYGSLIIHSVCTGTPRVVYGNMPNRGAIANLPDDAIAEAPTLVVRNGCTFTQVGPLPPQCLGYMQPHVIQHELFIRAALEGRRDHVYQAAMFDPLTSATLTLDQIVEMCDELIAGHGFIADGGTLPPLDVRKSLVPASGKRFARADLDAMKQSWRCADARDERECIVDWQVIGPFFAEAGARLCLETPTPIDAELERRRDGSVDSTLTHNGLRWRPARAGKRGYVCLDSAVGRHEWAIAYGYAEIESPRACDAVLRCGSNDGIRIHLNGELVHHNEVGRAYSPYVDSAPVRLKKGTNRLLVKIDNYTLAWGFGMAVVCRTGEVV